MEVVLMNHELNIGTISGYSADELVDRIVEVIPVTAVQKEYTKVETLTVGQQESSYSNISVVSNQLQAIGFPLISSTATILPYEYVSVVLSVYFDVSGQVTTTSSYAINFDATYAENTGGSKSLLLGSTSLSTSSISLGFGGNVAMYISYRYPGGYAYKINLSDDWIYANPHAYLNVKSVNGASGTLKARCRYTFESAYGVVR